MLGLSEWKSGDPDAAEEAFAYALEIKPDHVKSLINLRPGSSGAGPT